MKRTIKRKITARSKDYSDTATRLVTAALAEFCVHGFSGTDSNKIAKRAGFAPQTFYRWFKDKTEVFVAAYRLWEEEERSVLDALASKKAGSKKLAGAIIEHHRRYLRFRRSLRQLAVEDPLVRKARAESRMRQVEHIREWRRLLAGQDEAVLIILLQIERLADTAAEGEAQDLGIPDSVFLAAIVRLIDSLR